MMPKYLGTKFKLRQAIIIITILIIIIITVLKRNYASFPALGSKIATFPFPFYIVRVAFPTLHTRKLELKSE